MSINSTKWVGLTVLSLLPLFAQAAVSEWKIDTKESKVTFTATQNNAPVKGDFKGLSGKIQFDPEQLNASSVQIVVDMNSVATSYAPIADTLKTGDWFNVKLFPSADFKSKKITKTAEKNYMVEGDLTVHGKVVPATIQFTLEDYSKEKAKVKGDFSVKRTQFGVGQGEWASTKEIQDDVKVSFNINLIPAK